MFRPYRLFFRVIIFSMLMFSVCRLIFILFNRHDIPEASGLSSLFAEALFIGLRFDLVIACYLSSIFLIFLFVRHLMQRRWQPGMTIFRWYFTVTFSIALLICCADIPYFGQFGNHLNKQFSVWMNSPKIVIGFIFSNVMYWGFLLLFLVFVWLIYRNTARIFRPEQEKVVPRKWLSSVLIFLLLGTLTFVGMRGRTAAKSPIRIGTAFFSEHYFFNQLGLNPCFVFIKSVTENDPQWTTLSEGFTEAKLKDAIAAISLNDTVAINTGFERQYSFASAPDKKNVVIVLMESMAMAKMGGYGYPHLTASLDTLANQGLFFNNFFSAGIHTFNGVFSTETGFPAVMDVHPLNTYIDKKFNGLSWNLHQQGYFNMFFTSHDAQFDNLEGFMKFNDFDKVYSQADYPWKEVISTLGVPDHYLYNYAVQRMDEANASGKPFFSYILSSTDHTPYVLPENIPFKPTAATKEERATQYADWAIGQFIAEAKKHSWFSNTLFVFVADHGMHMGNTYSMPLAYHHIPCIMYCPSALKPEVNSNFGGQIDVMPTVLSTLQIPFSTKSMGIDLRRESRPYMYFAADNKTGCIDSSFYFMHLYDENKDLLYRYENLDTKDLSTSMKARADSMKAYGELMLRATHYMLSGKRY